LEDFYTPFQQLTCLIKRLTLHITVENDNASDTDVLNDGAWINPINILW